MPDTDEKNLADLLNSLHTKVAKRLCDELDKEDLDKGMVTNAIRFLKDNGIDSIPIDNGPVDKLAEKVKTLRFNQPDESITQQESAAG